MTHKKGMVMVYVLIFMLISQLVYWGLLRFNQINMVRYVSYEDYYTAKIQEKMTEYLFIPYQSEDFQAFEWQLIDNLQDNILKYSPTNIIEWIDLSDQFGIARLEQDGYEQLYVFTQKIYLPEEYMLYGKKANNINISGTIGDKNMLHSFDTTDMQQFDTSYIDITELFTETQKLLLEQGFREMMLSPRQVSYQWVPQNINPLNVITNKGWTAYSRSNGVDKLTTNLYQRNFNRELKGKQTNIYYIVSWNGYLFEREL